MDYSVKSFYLLGPLKRQYSNLSHLSIVEFLNKIVKWKFFSELDLTLRLRFFEIRDKDRFMMMILGKSGGSNKHSDVQ